MSLDRNPLRHQLAIYGPAALLVVAAFILAFQFIKPAPPDHVVIATGGVDGAYYAFAKRYAEYLAREGITLEVRATKGSVENLALLGKGEVSLALVQGGVDGGGSASALTSLGSVYYEPLWLFHRRDLVVERLSDLAGARLAVGPQGSGTRALAGRLLADNGIGEQADWADLGGEGAVDALLAGDVDAAFFVISAHSDAVKRLLRDPRIALADFTRAEAYGRRYRFLRHLELPEGVVDLAANIPERTVHLLATTANLVSSPDLHPAVVDLMLLAATEVHKEGGLFEGQDEFPMPGLLAFPLNSEAERFYDNGPPFLQRFLPFWAASLVDRLKVMLLPLLVLMFPLIKVMPPIYTWRMRARVYRWYDELELAEQRLGTGDIDNRAYFLELDRIEAEVRLVKVPLSFTDQLFNLRQHIELLRRRATR
ncbi:MAG: TAXI family TRAP transporter solute-binding subunit [Gammaproteobacteria bacterium]|nr:TAXI family TRAP transporter solute-binding subunit [Gammaproteobacteria bacterium]HOP17778.1 TAXI family TRAP transporter solute-binding subunit [Gammaproteobacteria bacterium]